MRYLLFSVAIAWLSGCASYYKNLQSATLDAACAERIRPQGIDRAWFDAGVEVIGKHISGLLLIKEMPDQSSRLVFTNEAGLTFFDFEFGKNGEFAVKKIIRQLDKKPVIETLRKDFSLLLGVPFQNELRAWRHGDELYYGVLHNSEKMYFTTNADCTFADRLEIGSTRKRKVVITREGAPGETPRQITIQHFTFDMTITLKRIQKDAD